MTELERIASGAVQRALDGGATDAECTIAEGEEFSASVRMREVESLKEAGSRGAGIRVLVGQRAGSSYSSDLSPEGIEKMVHAALELAKITSEDPHAGLPEREDLGSLAGDLQLYDETVAGMDTEWKISQARQAEGAALAADPRIQNSEGASFDSHVGRRVFANSRGFVGSYLSSSCGLSVVPVAKQNGSMERDYWHTIARSAARLESPEEVGRHAAERALRRLNPRKAATQKAPVVFEPRTARSLLGDLFDAVNGGAIYRHASFLAGKLGEKIASETLTVVDDATIPGLFGTCPFDDEGVASRRTVVIDKGVLKSYLLNTYTARKLGLKTTGNAGGIHNLIVSGGPRALDYPALLARMGTGFLVTELMGQGVNGVTGDYSRGASGFWIEGGAIAYPVHEVTIAGNLNSIYREVAAIGTDVDLRGAIRTGSVLVGEMMIAGE
jgi:PmbA protein